MDVAAFVISIAAFVLALVSFIWHIANTVRASRARAAEESPADDPGSDSVST